MTLTGHPAVSPPMGLDAAGTPCAGRSWATAALAQPVPDLAGLRDAPPIFAMERSRGFARRGYQ